MRKISTALLFVAWACLLPVCPADRANAADLSYSYLDITYQQGDAEHGNSAVARTGYGASGSYAIHERLFVQANFLFINTEEAVQLTHLFFTAGVHYPLTQNTDLMASLGVAHLKQEEGETIDYDEPVVFSAGVRTLLRQGFELEATIAYLQSDGFGSETRYEAGILWYPKVLKIIGLGAKATQSDDTILYNAFLRSHF